MKSILLFSTILMGIVTLALFDIANGIQCYKCAYNSVQFPVENVTFYDACDIYRDPDSKFLQECDDQSCLTVSNYKNSKGINFVYRTCIPLSPEYERKCRNFTKAEAKVILAASWVDALDSDVEGCACKTDGCNWDKETPSTTVSTKPSTTVSTTPLKSSMASNMHLNPIIALVVTVFFFLLVKI